MLELGFFFCLLGLFSLISFQKQIILRLISLEFIVLGLFLGLVFYFLLLGLPISFAFYIIVLSACEASLGLRLLVCITSHSGSDLL